MSKWIKFTLPYQGHFEDIGELVEMWDWFEDNIKGRIKFGVSGKNNTDDWVRWWKFKEEDDAVAFKLRWL